MKTEKSDDITCLVCGSKMKYKSIGYLEVEEQEAVEYECECCGHTEYFMV